jgi:RNA polymerase sigma-70 factor (ECF subfamily)
MESIEHRWPSPETGMVERGEVERGIERIYRERLERFVRVTAAIVGDSGLAVDVVHDGFARALAHASGFRGTGSLEGWVWRVVVNEARRRAGARPAPGGSDIGAASQASGEELLWVRQVVAQLPERQRLALFLRYYADLDYDGIATAMNVATGTVAATLSQAHAALRRTLEEADGGD